MKISTVVIQFLLLVSFWSASWAQESRGISTRSFERVTLKPERMRLILWIKAQGIDAKSAISVLAEHRERVQRELEELRADKQSIAFTTPRTSSSNISEEPQAQRMLRLQMNMIRRPNGGPAQLPELPPIFTASCAVRAEWILPVIDGDTLALFPANLREQVAELDLVGMKNKPNFTDSDRKKFEEVEAAMGDQYTSISNANAEPTGPIISFVATVSDEMVSKATEVAYRKAVTEAERLSAATGIKLGRLTAVTSSVIGVEGLEQNATAYYSSSRLNQERAIPQSLLIDQKPVVSNAIPDDMAFSVNVFVSYAIE
jgi:uncharacterized protein YggE